MVLFGFVLLFTLTSFCKSENRLEGCFPVPSRKEIYNKNAIYVALWRDDNPCYCDPIGSDQALVTCLYGSKVENTYDAIKLVTSLNKTVTKLYLKFMYFRENGLNFFKKLDLPMEDLTIQSCRDFRLELAIDDDAFRSFDETLVNLTIKSCEISTIPEAIRRLKNLKRLKLSKNLTHLQAGDFEGLENLEFLDLSDNHLKFIDPIAFKPLKGLQELQIRPSWYHILNETIFEAINDIHSLRKLQLYNIRVYNWFKGPLKNLKKLEKFDFTTPDWKNFTAMHSELFRGMKNLKELQLTLTEIEAIEIGAFKDVNLENLRILNLAGNNIKVIEQGMFEGLENITFLAVSLNHVQDIAPNSFSNLENLQHLSLGANRIKRIKPKTFGGLENLKILQLGPNSLSGLNPQMFSGLKSLEHLNLYWNKIEEIKPNTFLDQKMLLKLNLEHNKLTYISPDGFKGLENLQSLDLSSQRDLKYLNVSVFDHLPSLESIDLSENKWKCDENFMDFAVFLNEKTKNGTLVLKNLEKTVCYEPEEMKGKNIVAMFETMTEIDDDAFEILRKS